MNMMPMAANRSWLVAISAPATMLLSGLLWGCGTSAPSGGGSSGPSASAENEPNDSFADAEKATFTTATTSRVSATIDNQDDVDVYDIGPISVGDRIVADIEATTPELDLVAVLYDQDFNLFMDNDDRNLDADLFDPFLEQTARHSGGAYFLAVGRSAFAGSSPSVGDYAVTIQVFAGNTVPDTKTQYVLLNFEGGEVEPDNLLRKFVDPFDAGAINRIYAGEDEPMIAAILDAARENFNEYEVEFFTDVDQIPAGAEFATIMMGSRSSRAFGIAEAIDHFNANLMDTAIIFTESFSPDQFTSTPTTEQLGIAIGNIASHELGHLMGLNHVDDEIALMDAVSPPDTFLADQDFKIAPLSGTILPLGNQNSPSLLSESVGLLPGAAIPLKSRSALPAGPRLRNKGVTSWCGTCGRKAGR